MTEEQPQEQANPVVTTAMQAFAILMDRKNVLEIYAAFGILQGKMSEFASIMAQKLQAQEAENEDNSTESPAVQD